MVTILSLALIALTGIEQERITLPLMCTEHAPHCATPHPYLVPVRPTFSRSTHSRGVSASTCTSRTLPLILSFAMSLLRHRVIDRAPTFYRQAYSNARRPAAAAVRSILRLT